MSVTQWMPWFASAMCKVWFASAMCKVCGNLLSSFDKYNNTGVFLLFLK